MGILVSATPEVDDNPLSLSRLERGGGQTALWAGFGGFISRQREAKEELTEREGVGKRGRGSWAKKVRRNEIREEGRTRRRKKGKKGEEAGGNRIEERERDKRRKGMGERRKKRVERGNTE